MNAQITKILLPNKTCAVQCVSRAHSRIRTRPLRMPHGNLSTSWLIRLAINRLSTSLSPRTVLTRFTFAHVSVCLCVLAHFTSTFVPLASIQLESVESLSLWPNHLVLPLDLRHRLLSHFHKWWMFLQL